MLSWACDFSLHMLQVQEDGVLAHEVSQQFCHVGDAMWDDRQPLPAHHVTPGEALHDEGSSSCRVLNHLHLLDDANDPASLQLLQSRAQCADGPEPQAAEARVGTGSTAQGPLQVAVEDLLCPP